MATSLIRIPFRPAASVGAAAGWTCTRCLSTSSRRGDAFDLLNILPKSSITQTQPSNKEPAQRTPSLATRMAGQALPSARQVEETAEKARYQRQMYRKWQPGDVYAPHDLSGPEQKKWKLGSKTPQSDAFDRLGINPISEYKNFTLMSEYMTEMGRIKHSRDTGLRPKNQRKIAKAIRRAIGLGLMPSVHRHPLVLKKSSPSRFL